MRIRVIAPAAAACILSIGSSLTLGGCSKPALVGAQVTKAPPHFMFDANATAARLVFHDRPKVDQRGYFYMTRDDEHCSIMITEYAGSTTYEEAKAALEYHRRKYPYPTYGTLESLRVDGRSAWGWMTEQHHKGELSSITFHAVIPYEEEQKTYTVEFYAGVDKFMDEGLLRDTVTSFTVKKDKEVSYGAIGFLAVVVVGVAVGFRKIRPAA